MKKLDTSKRIILAATLFGMFFGAGNLIFPVHLGQLAGNQYLISAIGFCITAVGIPILGVAAIGSTYSNGLQDLASKVSKGYGIFFTLILYLTIGPFFAIPRCATLSYTIGVSPLLGENIQQIGLIVFSFIFFALVLYFSLKPGKITDWIGKYINPLFLIFLFILILVALFKNGLNISSVIPEEAYQTNAFFTSIIDGYETMDAIAGLAFGIVIINVIKSWGISDDKTIASEVLKSGALAGLLMALIYFLMILIGANTKELFGLSENGGIALRQIASYYLGTFGSVILALTISLACLKTSIGLVISCSETFEKLANKKISYKAFAIGICVFAFAVSNIGLSLIIEYSVPVLMFIYPLAIVLIILALSGNVHHHNTIVYKTTIGFTLVAALFDLCKALPTAVIELFHLNGFINIAEKYLPLFDLNLGWLLPAFIGFVLGMILKHFLSR